MGETLQRVTPSFNRSLRIESRTDRLTGDPGAVVLREILERSGILGWMTARLKDPRSQVDVTHDLASLIRTWVLLSAQGWRDHDDADALRQDPAFRLAASSAAGLTPLGGPGLASQPTLSRFTALMAEPANLKVLREAVLELAGRGIRAERRGKKLPCVTLDVDSAPIEVHGHQPKAEWNGHYNARIYHPLITSIAETGDMLDARLRPGNVGTADGALDVILDVVDRARKTFCDVAMVRIDAGFPSAALLAGLDARGIDYVSRLRANPVLDRLAEPCMKRPPGRRPAEPRSWLYELRYQADSWDKPRRVIAKIEWHPGELFPKVGFIVTNLPMEPDWVVRFYNRRGTAEQHIKEGKYAFRWTRLSCKKFHDNEVRLQLHALAYNLATFLRCIELPEEMAQWSLTSLQLKLIKIGARVVRHARAITFQLAEVAITGSMVRAILAAIRRLRAPPLCA